MTPSRWRPLAIGLGSIALLALPLWYGQSYYIKICNEILYWAIFALALDVLVGYAGLVSLGHAGLFAIAAYTVALMLEAGHGHAAADLAALGAILLASAIYAVLALRSTGIGFLMITLALGQIVWGLAYRGAALTHGDNGVNVRSLPAPFGIDLASPQAFYILTVIVYLVALGSMALFVRSPFGASLSGTRVQARRMTALGFNVWLIRFLAFLLSGFWTGIAALLYVYQKQYIGPPTAALQTSAEVLLMVIAGGTATLLGPSAGAAIVVVMKNVVSAYVARWNLVLGVVFVVIISFMPEGFVPGSMRLGRMAWQSVVARLNRRAARHR